MGSWEFVMIFMLVLIGGADMLLSDVPDRGSKVALGIFNDASAGRSLDAAEPRAEQLLP